MSWSDERSAIRLLIEVGNCFVMFGGWLESLFMYNGSSLGFLKGLYFPLLRSKVTSKKFTVRKFPSAVIFNPNSSKIWWSSFLVLSAKRPKELTALTDFIAEWHRQ